MGKNSDTKRSIKNGCSIDEFLILNYKDVRDCNTSECWNDRIVDPKFFGQYKKCNVYQRVFLKAAKNILVCRTCNGVVRSGLTGNEGPKKFEKPY